MTTGDPLRTLAELIAHVTQTLRGGDDPAARADAARDVEQLRELVARVAAQPVAPAGFDVAEVSDALRHFATWLREPTSANEAQAQQAITELQIALGPLVVDPAREDAARREQYRQEARAALDDYFRDRSGKP
jgi:hypothetical protein